MAQFTTGQKMQAFAAFQLFIAVVYFAICVAALSSDYRYFIPEIFGIQLVFSITFLISPILGLLAVAKNSPETAFWHAMLSASGIALAIAAAILAAYGTALGTAMSSYYESLNENAVDAAYSGWIVGAPVVCMICNILLGTVFTLTRFYRTI